MATKAPKDAVYLYKFRGVSNLRWLIDILVRQRLYAASYDELNDPMEGYFLFDPSTEADVKANLRDLRKRTGICSLSKNYTNTLMWSFYGEDHKGICIKLAVTSKGWEKREIRYEKSLPVITDEPKKYLDLMSSKSIHWKYENEERYIRVFDSQGKMRKSRFLSIYIDAIYLGYKMNDKDVTFYTKLFQSLLPYLTKDKIRQLKRTEIDTGFDNV